MKRFFTAIISLALALSITFSASAEGSVPIYGIDVSYWQGEINWGSVAQSGQEFAIIRVGYNDKQDAMFEANYQNAKAAGIPVGCYMYSYAITEQAAVEEAEIVMERIKGKQFEYPIYLDVEDSKLLSNGLTKEQRTANALAFVRKMQENGYYVGVYANLDWFTNYLDVKAIQAECETWVAHYNENYDYSNTDYGMWQYTDKGLVNGITENTVDLNICYKDYPSIIKKYGYNGYPKSEGTGVKGDIDASGDTNLLDVVALAQYVAGWENVFYIESELNANGDIEEAVDLNDVVWLAQYVAGWKME